MTTWPAFSRSSSTSKGPEGRSKTQSGGDHTGDQDGDPAPKRVNRHLRAGYAPDGPRPPLPAQPLIDGLLYRTPSGSSRVAGRYKTFVVIATSRALAAGESFGGSGSTPGKVVYVAAEGRAG